MNQQQPAINFSRIPSHAKIIGVSAELPLENGGVKVLRYEVASDGSLVAHHYCRPPHGKETSIYSPANWKCPDCGEVWWLRIATWYETPNANRLDIVPDEW